MEMALIEEVVVGGYLVREGVVREGVL